MGFFCVFYCTQYCSWEPECILSAFPTKLRIPGIGLIPAGIFKARSWDVFFPCSCSCCGGIFATFGLLWVTVLGWVCVYVGGWMDGAGERALLAGKKGGQGGRTERSRPCN